MLAKSLLVSASSRSVFGKCIKESEFLFNALTKRFTHREAVDCEAELKSVANIRWCSPVLNQC